MHTKQIQNSSTIRFRRWSRVGYAIFCSLAFSVTIGSLSVSVSDKTLQKADGVALNEVAFKSSNANSKDKEVLELEAILHQNLEVSFSEMSDDCTTACSQLFYNIINCNG